MKPLTIKMPAFLKKFSRRTLIVTSAVLAAVVLFLTISSIVLSSIPRHFGEKINFDNVFHINYSNSTEFGRDKALYNSSDRVQDQTIMREILKRLERGGKTNSLTKMFVKGKQEIIENKDSNISHTSSFASTYPNNAITIWFLNPQYSEPKKADLPLAHFAPETHANYANNVYGILIPLDHVNNRFQAQTWYIVVAENFTSGNSGLARIGYKMSTFGNYSKLWNYVNEIQTM